MYLQTFIINFLTILLRSHQISNKNKKSERKAGLKKLGHGHLKLLRWTFATSGHREFLNKNKRNPSNFLKNIQSFQAIPIVPQVPRYGAEVAEGAPCENLHCPQAVHFSTFTLFSRVQNLHDQNLYLVSTSFGFCVPQSSHMGAKGCNNPPLYK